jgi:hypothetical protein
MVIWYIFPVLVYYYAKKNLATLFGAPKKLSA